MQMCRGTKKEMSICGVIINLDEPQPVKDTKLTDQQISLILSMVRNWAANARETAGFNGRWDDGGAGAMEAQAKFYEYGMRRECPPDWGGFFDDANKILQKEEFRKDPEYKEYLRLQSKFGKA